jgi:hypothetical protein
MTANTKSGLNTSLLRQQGEPLEAGEAGGEKYLSLKGGYKSEFGITGRLGIS